MNQGRTTTGSRAGDSPLRLLQFCLFREEDVSGTSGKGIVAYGVVLPSGKAVLEWVTRLQSVAIYESLEVLEQVHSHEGRTQIRLIR